MEDSRCPTAKPELTLLYSYWELISGSLQSEIEIKGGGEEAAPGIPLSAPSYCRGVVSQAGRLLLASPLLSSAAQMQSMQLFLGQSLQPDFGPVHLLEPRSYRQILQMFTQ